MTVSSHNTARMPVADVDHGSEAARRGGEEICQAQKFCTIKGHSYQFRIAICLSFTA